jgi:1-acyl-sn-glycerol-3-phosphate acyltransferase
VPNHQGAFDIFLIYGYLGRNFKWMMKKSLRKIPFVGKACESAGHIFVDRSGPRKVMETIRQAKSSLTDGVSLVVFPEGARSFTGHMGYFKKGAFQLADELQLEVVPVTISGSFKILPRTGKWIHRHRMTLTIHDPIPPRGHGIENIKATMAEAYAVVESALPEEYRGKVMNPDQEVD